MFLYIFLIQTQDPSGAGPLWTLMPSFKQTAMLHTTFQAPELRDSEEEDFLNIFLCINMVQTQDPLFSSETFICINFMMDNLGNVSYQISSI